MVEEGVGRLVLEWEIDGLDEMRSMGPAMGVCWVSSFSFRLVSGGFQSLVSGLVMFNVHVGDGIRCSD